MLVVSALGVVSFPLAYQAIAHTPWSVALFQHGDRSASPAVIGTILFLHSIGLGGAFLAARPSGMGAAELALPLDPMRFLVLSAGAILVGLELVAIRELFPYGDGVPRGVPLAP